VARAVVGLQVDARVREMLVEVVLGLLEKKKKFGS
jgi:hypothetical protein